MRCRLLRSRDMDRAQVHREFLKCLMAEVGKTVGRVRLLSRLYNDELLGGDSASRAFVFLPDFHVLSELGASKYAFHFLRSTGRVQRDALLDRVCAAIL